MKKVYIPTEEELQRLKYLGVDIYKYLLSKTTETIIMEDIIYEEIDMLDTVYEQLSEFSEIIYSIARMYPEKIALSEYAKKDINLARLLTKKLTRQDNSIYQLDALSYFGNESPVLSDSVVMENTIKHLAENLTSAPRYRFDYKEPNILLDDIFACEIEVEKITDRIQNDLISIDPIYITKLGSDSEKAKKDYSQNKLFYLTRGLIRYTNRFYLEEINRTNQQEKTKKLVRYLDNHKRNYQP